MCSAPQDRGRGRRRGVGRAHVALRGATRRLGELGVLRRDLGRELELAPALGDQALRPQHHHDHQQEAEDPELHLGQLEVQPELAGQVVEHVRDQVVVDVASTTPPTHRPPDRAEAAEDDHREDEDRERELELVGVDHGVGTSRGTRPPCRRTRRRSRRRAASSCTSGMPIDTAATSSSRSAIQARPSRESRRRKLTNRTRSRMREDQPVPRSEVQQVERPDAREVRLVDGVMPRLPAVSVMPPPTWMLWPLTASGR